MEPQISKSAQNPEYKIIPFEFTGKAGEYFSIWIVNMALTILTLGIYSAWAKVRTQQYLYGSTRLDGASFRYLADPKQILKGRLIAAVFFAAYYFSGLLSPVVGAATAVVLLVLMPYILVASMSFRARISEWRHVRLGFVKDYSKAYKLAAIPLIIVALNTVLPVLLLGQDDLNSWQHGKAGLTWYTFVLIGLTFLFLLMIPWLDHAINQYRFQQLKFGRQQFTFKSALGKFHRFYIYGGFVLPLVFISGGFGLMGLLGGLDILAQTKDLLGVVGVLMYFWLAAYFQTRRRNAVLNNVTLGNFRLYSKLTITKMWFLYISNTIAIVCSIGLLYPWAKIRTLRYKASKTGVIALSDMSVFAADQLQHQSALGEEMGEFFDMDIGI